MSDIEKLTQKLQSLLGNEFTIVTGRNYWGDNNVYIHHIKNDIFWSSQITDVGVKWFIAEPELHLSKMDGLMELAKEYQFNKYIEEMINED